MGDDTLRRVTVERTDGMRFRATNERGGTVDVAADGTATFTPVELLLAALAACGAADVDAVTSRRAQPTAFTVVAQARKVRDEEGNRLEDVHVTYTVRFADGEAGDAARAALPRALQVSHDRACTVSRTVERGTPVAVRLA